MGGNMEDNTLLIVGLGAIAFLVMYKPEQVGAVSTAQVLAAASTSGFVTKDLVPISGANWTIPLFLTMDRNIPLGTYGLETLFTIGSAIAGGVTTAASYIGNTLGTALSTANQVVSGTVIPAIVNASGTVATYVSSGASNLWSGISTGASYIGTGAQWLGGEIVDLGKAVGGATISEVKALPGQIADIGKNVWDYTKIAGGYVWDKITGTWTYVSDLYKQSALFATVTKAVGGAAATLIANKVTNKSDNTTNQKSSIPTSSSAKLIPLGYISKTQFDSPKSMIVTKMYNPSVLDTRLVTDDNALNTSIQLGYQVQEKLGYCSPAPFYGCVNMISMYNPKIIDSIVITNYNIIPQLENMGYQSLGTIGYCKALP